MTEQSIGQSDAGFPSRGRGLTVVANRRRRRFLSELNLAEVSPGRTQTDFIKVSALVVSRSRHGSQHATKGGNSRCAGRDPCHSARTTRSREGDSGERETPGRANGASC